MRAVEKPVVNYELTGILAWIHTVQVRIGITVVLIIISGVLTFFSQQTLHLNHYFTHIYYIPALVAAIWWKKRGIAAPIILAIMLVSSRVYFHDRYIIDGDILRLIMLFAVFILVVILREHISQTEMRLFRINEALEQRVALRTQELADAHNRLLKQEKLVALGQLAGIVSHELRNPLGVIKNVSYFLSMAVKDAPPQVKEALRILDRQVDSSDKIIGNLLDFARPKPLVKQEVIIGDIIETTLRQLEVPANIEVKVHVHAIRGRLLADPDQFMQVFSNIILNAIQALQDGGQITILCDQQGNGYCSVRVIDNGPGISPGDLNEIFEPLFTTKSKGIGLGLAHAKNLVEKHKGTIKAESVLGEGTTIRIEFPAELKN